MTNHTPKPRPSSRRTRHAHVTTARREQSPKRLARIITGIALGDAQRETEARAEHLARLARRGVLESRASRQAVEGAGDA